MARIIDVQPVVENPSYSGGNGASSSVPLSMIDTIVDFTGFTDAMPKVRVFAKSVFGLNGNLGFGQGSFGGGTYKEVAEKEVEFLGLSSDDGGFKLKLMLPDYYYGDYKVKKVSDSTYQLTSISTDIEFRVILSAN